MKASTSVRIILALSLLGVGSASFARSKKSDQKSAKHLIDRTSIGKPTGNERQRRIQTFMKLELLQLAFIESMQDVRDNPDGAALGRFGEIALILGRFEDAGRLQSELLQRGVTAAAWPGSFRAAVTGFFLELGNYSTAAKAAPTVSQIQSLAPRARIKAAAIVAAVAATQGRGNQALDALRVNIDRNGDYSLLYLQRARILYEMGRLTDAMEELTNVPRTSPSWYPGLFVSSWSSYRAGDMNLTLGLLMSMHTPYLRDKFNPESYVLEASTLYRLCYFEAANRSLKTLKERYKSMPTSIGRAERQLESRADSVNTLLAYAANPDQSAPWNIDSDDWKLVADGLLADPGMAEVSLQLDEIEKAQTFLKSSSGKNDSANLRIAYNSYDRELDRARVEAQHRGRKLMLSKISLMKAEASEALENALAVEVEINSRIRERLASGKLPKYKDIDFDAEVNKGYEFWPYQGEFWRDEAGSYVFATSDVCAGEGTNL